MRFVKCMNNNIIHENGKNLKIGNKYWVDDNEGCCCIAYNKDLVCTYADENKKEYIDLCDPDNFETINRGLKYRCSLLMYVNTHTELLLKDILEWCMNNLDMPIACSVLKIINDENLLLKENIYKCYVVNHSPYDEFIKRDRGSDYMKYLGYSLYCVD